MDSLQNNISLQALSFGRDILILSIAQSDKLNCLLTVVSYSRNLCFEISDNYIVQYMYGFYMVLFLAGIFELRPAEVAYRILRTLLYKKIKFKLGFEVCTLYGGMNVCVSVCVIVCECVCV